MLEPPFNGAVVAAMLTLNNAYAKELSFKSQSEFIDLLAAASHVRALPDGEAFIVAFHEECTYDNPNFEWFKKRFDRFYYIDRVVVAQAQRGKGVARQFYADLEKTARVENRARLVCEINSVPANPASDNFHLDLGFLPVGEQVMSASSKTVRYWSKQLA